MKFPRNARIFRGRLDMAPFAAVFFLLVMFLLLASLVYTPGVRLQVPMANDLPGTDKPTVSVAIDANGRLYFENELIDANELKSRLRKVVERSGEPLTLAVQADEKVSYKQLINLTMLARHAGFREVLLATLPGPLSRAANPEP